jgi:hypothetical protein
MMSTKKHNGQRGKKRSQSSHKIAVERLAAIISLYIDEKKKNFWINDKSLMRTSARRTED